MTQIEMSLSETFPPSVQEPAAPAFGTGLIRWAATAAEASERCVVIDADTKIVAASLSCCQLFGMGHPTDAVGQPLLDVLRLIDFTANRAKLTETETDKIPPLLALSSGRLARGLMRVACPDNADADETVDGIATPLWDDTAVSGSLTFFAKIT